MKESIMEGALLNPTMTSKLRAKESAMKMRFGSPKLQEVLRERCRQQMKLKRGMLFNNKRWGIDLSTKDVQETLTEIIRKEFNNLGSTESAEPFLGVVNEPLSPEEALELENEIIAEEEQWILEEYEKMCREELELLALTVDVEDDQVICPMCQKFYVIQNKDYIKCKGCNFQLDSCNTVKFFGHTLNYAIESHSNTCSQTPGFTLFPENGKRYLYMLCQHCSLFMPII